MNPRTQAALYAEIDLELSWSEDELPQIARTKHVHSLHPYLGKFIPQLVEVFLHRHFSPGDCIYDPFVGSGTTLVEANVFGAIAIGCDSSACNCLLARVKTGRYSLGELELARRGALEDMRHGARRSVGEPTPWLSRWYAPQALEELLAYRSSIGRLPTEYGDVARVILSRAARSARLTTHFDLDFPRRPTTKAYYCHKHKRTCRPVQEARKFLARYTTDTIRRIRDFGSVRTNRNVSVLHADSRDIRLPATPNGVVTSPPYPGLIDYHEQHRYAYELLGLADRRHEEIGAAAAGRARDAVAAYVDSASAAFAHTRRLLAAGSRVLIVVNGSRALHPPVHEQ